MASVSSNLLAFFVQGNAREVVDAIDFLDLAPRLQGFC